MTPLYSNQPAPGGGTGGTGGASVLVHTNRLAHETSPYLLQHAHNPVDWYPWGAEALDRARKENKPIFLSIGYSSCHWCHVMEHESFEDPGTADALNARFIAIKVDREERPDLDEIYMTAVQMITGSGGWPLNVFLTPDLKPFFGGTYFPPEERHGMASFRQILNLIAETWETNPDRILSSAEDLAVRVRMLAEPAPAGGELSFESAAARAVETLQRDFDPRWGGFGRAPKFPPAAAVALLMRRYVKSPDPVILRMITLTLDRMAQGGVYDQIGGGFHRYSVDERWLVPHFEKMLYDNAQLSRVYVEAWQLTHKPLYRRIAVETLDYVLRDMTDPRGGFYSAEDADSEGREGKFYVWTPNEIRDVLGEKDGALFLEAYGVTATGNFEGTNILHLSPQNLRGGGPGARTEPDEGAGEALEQTVERLTPLRFRLLDERARRPRPGRDEKALAAWNGMMISGLARAYAALGEKRYLRAAEKAAAFVLSEMTAPDGGLLRVWRQGAAKQPAFLDDYAELSNGLVDLYEATFNLRWLDWAETLVQAMIRNFWDEKDGAFFFTSPGRDADLLVHTKPFYDGVVPSGNSAAALALARLGDLLGKNSYLEKARRTAAFNGDLARAPQAFLNMLTVVSYLDSPVEIVIVGPKDAPDSRELLDQVRGHFLPNKVLAQFDPAGRDAACLRKRIPLLDDRGTIDGKATAYVCRKFTCERPVTTPEALAKLLD